MTRGEAAASTMFSLTSDARFWRAANSARTPWIAYGDRYQTPSRSLIARHWNWSFNLLICKFGMGTVARTELGIYKDGAGLTKALGQIYSGSRAQFTVKCTGLSSKNISLFGISSLDDAFKTKSTIYSPPGTASGLLATLIAKALGALFGGLVSYAKQYAPVDPDTRLFWLSPYAPSPNRSFAPLVGCRA